MKENLRKQWNEACLQAGIESISVLKAAKTMAVLIAPPSGMDIPNGFVPSMRETKTRLRTKQKPKNCKI